ncbi:MAG TPA: metalloregulator ArsR/SmtB family transcription factor [Bryobacteraceae bacterium]|nr:metalloregulator ArsR/SmtB family transcription factor [Bryobacteraceae bacterium]
MNLTAAAPGLIFNQVVEHSSEALTRVFAAVADPTRRAILAALAQKPATVTEIAKPFPVSLNAISKHILVLERAGLIIREVAGREHHCRLDAAPLRKASAWLDHYLKFWDVRLDALERHIVTRKKREKRTYGRTD